MLECKEVNVLLVDDDELDREIVFRAFRKSQTANTIVMAENGVEALETLRGENGKSGVPRPYIILLDLNMPLMGGIEFLKLLRQSVDLRDAVVFVLTTSSHEVDIRNAYKHNVAGYILKSEVGSDFLKLVDLLDQYWQIVELPSKSDSEV